MRKTCGRTRGLFALVLALALALGGTYHAIAQEDDSPDCAEQGSGDGASGGQGGTGGGMCGGGGAGGAGTKPGATGEPSGGGNGTAGGGEGGNGSNGPAGENNLPTPTPAPPSNQGVAGSGGQTAGASASPAPGATTTDAAVANLAKNLSTKPEEVRSWFGATNANDSVAGQARSIVVHPDDQVTIFAGDPVDTATDGGVLRTGIEGVGDANTKGGDTVQITLHSNPVALGNTLTEVGGRFSATVRIPPDTELGRHFIIALAPNTHQGRAAFIYPVTVAAREQAAPVAAENVTPTSGEPRRFPWLLVEFLLGTASVIALFVVRVRRASAAEF